MLVNLFKLCAKFFIEMLKLSINEYLQLVKRFDVWLFHLLLLPDFLHLFHRNRSNSSFGFPNGF